MNYEKTQCPTCLSITTNLGLMMGEAQKQTGVEFYDFGGGCTVAPVPDLGMGTGSTGKYLTDHMFAVQGTEDPYRITGIRFAFNDLTLEDLVEKVKKAAEYNKTQQEQFAII